jgi:hypothetical protein
MRVIRLLVTLISVPSAALVGNWIGDQARTLITGAPGHRFRFVHENDHGETVIALNPAFTNLVPALFVGLVSRPRWLGAFLAGLISSGLIGARNERRFRELIGFPRQDQRDAS